mmetsp:Transcript_1226/g.1110  ORF Transcript_1226/g.1110 Transcript_1226/m.1110 type:complete len:186 (+) Transcript_1226:568-1125(+)
MTSKKFSTTPIMSCPDFNNIVMVFSEFLANQMERDANKDIIFFFHELICNSDFSQFSDGSNRSTTDTQYIEYTGTALLLSIPNLKSMVSQTFGKILTHMFKENPEIMNNCAITAFQDPKFNGISDKIKELFIKCLAGFRNHPKEFKLTIMEFHSILRGSATEDVFIGRELKLVKLQTENEEIQLD